jgi:hypothetical protein
MHERAARWRIGLQADPVRLHAWFALTGLGGLRASGAVDLHLLARRLPVERSLWLEVEDREARVHAAVCLDPTDFGWLGAPRRSAAADITWKRGFDPAGYDDALVVPLGLMFGCRPGEGVLGARYAAAAATAGVRSGNIAEAARTLRVLAGWRASPPPPLDAHVAMPGTGDERVLFQVRAWEPDDGMDPADRQARNAQRAEVITTLRRRLGDRFVGGFVPTELARREHPELVTTTPSGTGAYLELVRSCAIGVSTIGLHRSNPYKLLEYVAASRAIVAEPLAHALPHPLVPGTNVVPFDDAASCADACEALLDDREARQRMMEANRAWWLQHGAPDVALRDRLEALAGDLGR